MDKKEGRYELIKRLASQIDLVEKTLLKDARYVFSVDIKWSNSICEICEYQKIPVLADWVMACCHEKNMHERHRESTMFQCRFYKYKGSKDGLSKET